MSGISLLDRERATIVIPLLKAYSEGATIQRFARTLNRWVDEDFPDFDPGWEWRVKPKDNHD